MPICKNNWKYNYNLQLINKKDRKIIENQSNQKYVFIMCKAYQN